MHATGVPRGAVRPAEGGRRAAQAAAGHPRLHGRRQCRLAHPDTLFRPLRRAGIEAADGFAVNVSNFQTTAASTEFGKQLSAKIGDKSFVIDTSRNGNGPYSGGAPEENWCNPPGRALGETPTTDTGDELVDAYLWVKRPGESDGDCKGGPKAGDWWPEYALGLARATK